MEMKTTIATTVLQDLVSKAVKASSFVVQIAITNLMQIKVENKKVYISTSDNNNLLEVFADSQSDDFKVVVDSKLFSQIVSKLSKENTTLTVSDKKLIIEADGKYNIPIQSDSDGSTINFPTTKIIENQPVNHVSVESLKSILTLSKICKSEMKENPAIYNYYADSEKILTYDFIKACYNPIKVSDKSICIPSEFMSLLPYVCDDNGVDITMDSDTILAYSSIGKLSGKLGSSVDLEMFPTDDIMDSIQKTLSHTCKLSNTLLSSALDRLNLFVDKINNGLTFTFTGTEVILKPLNSDCEEKIAYLQPLTESVEPVNIILNSVVLKSLLAVCNPETLTIKFENNISIQFILDKVVIEFTALG